MSVDLFTKARIKITFLYFLLGIIIVFLAGYFIYADLTNIIADTLRILQGILRAGTPIDENAAAAMITQTIDSQLKQMDLSIGVWLVIAMVLSAYILAGITLRPVKRAMERQKRFMVNISHELRTPLSVMKTSMETTLLAGSKLTREELIESKKSNLEEVNRMANIIDFLLNFSNLENRMSRLAPSNVDLADGAKAAIALVAPRAKTKNIKISLAAEPTTVSGNATAIEEMALNIVKNAVTYTPENGAIKVSVEKKYGAPTLTVEDNGQGISAHDLPNIFEAFYRGDDTVSGKVDRNAGLGLAIVREVALLHDAKITVKSRLGKGTTIAIRFPTRFSRWLTPWS